MIRSQSQMSLGLSAYKLGYHRAAWRMPDFPPDSMMSFSAFSDAARVAEKAKFDFVFFADIMAVENSTSEVRDITREHYVVKLDPVAALSAISSITSKIGLIGTISASYTDPYRIARSIGSLDVISGGRAGWNVVTSYSPDEMQNFGQVEPTEAGRRYARAHEAIEVVRGLWQSWDDGAFVVDKDTGQYFDRSRMRMLDHNGEFFSVRGPLDVAPSPQGLPVFVSAGDSVQARELAARYSNIQYAPTRGDLAQAKSHYRDVKERMEGFGRRHDDLKILPGLMPIVAESEGEALAKRDHIRSLIHPQVGFDLLRPLFGDLTRHNPSELLGTVVDGSELAEMARSLFQRAADEKLTIREVYEIVAEGEPWFMTFIGSTSQTADLMQRWFEEEAADGFNILPHYMPGGFQDFVHLVVPELQRRGLFRSEYPGTTLRQTLGLR